MPFNINTFKNFGLVFGGARPSLFEVFLTAPQTIGINQAAVDRFRFLCRAAELPEMTISNIEVPYFGRKIKVAGERSFADWGVTVINDEDFAVRSMLEAWQNSINRLVANIRDARLINEEGYKQDIIVQQYAKDGLALRSYLLVGAFPTTIGGIALDWDSANAVETFSVNFAYDYWVPLEDVANAASYVSLNNYRQAAEADGPLGPQ
jgi:hypothetical protein